MERLNDDVLGLVLERVSNGGDRKLCSEVSTSWFRIEAVTRTRVRVLDPERVPNFLPRFPNLTTLEVHTRISDQALTYVGEFCPNLRILDLSFLYQSEFPEDFTDEGLAAVARGCRRLVEVLLSTRRIGDDGIVALQTFTKGLAILDLSFCHFITDRSLAAIRDMESLSELFFQGCSLITDGGLSLLSSGPASRSLRVLIVRDCEQITDVGVLDLRRMSRLEELDLASCPEVTDVGGVAVSALSNLKKLDLSGLPEISDATLFALVKGCRNLVEISLDGCHEITGRGVVFLAASLPLERIDISNLEDYQELSSYHVLQIVEHCRFLKLLIVDEELEEDLSPSQREKLSGLVEWTEHTDTI